MYLAYSSFNSIPIQFLLSLFATVAKRLGRDWIGIELNEEYAKYIEDKTAQEELF